MTKLEYSPLLLSSNLLLCLSAIWILAAADAPAGQRPSCPAKCGEVDITFPFGIGEQCAIDSKFELHCNNTVGGTSRPFKGDFEVSKISVPDGKMWVKSTISSQCYDPATGGMKYFDAGSNFTNSALWVSEVDNNLIVIGCNTLAYMMSSTYVIGCYSTCTNVYPRNGSCSGAGCCQADVPKDIQYYRAYFNENYNTSTTWNWKQYNSPCSYMALMDRAAFKFETSYLFPYTSFNDTYKGKVPVVLNWKIGDFTCENARNMSSYACVSNNSKCVDTSNEPGYRCECSNGYQGNPYIADGCQDIDECHNENGTNPCGLGICENIPGNYSCSCHPGYYMMNGQCMPIQKSTSPVLPVVGASVGFVLLVITITCAYLIQERRKLQKLKQNYFREHGGQELFESITLRQGKSNAFKIFSEEELQQATNRFSEQQVLGQGGHGTVYKALLKGNMEVAVKRCKTIDEQHKKDFGNEMLILSQINHINIVKLLGCCLEVEVPMLVYEFMPNGTLFQLIHGDRNRHISLETRLQIAHESAEALAYLHSWASPPILHGDVKSSNILLDGDYTAKISDFGASILDPTDESQFATLVQGTCGYLDPEYVQTCQLTDKSDVYSFGVVLLELLTRKKPFSLEAPEHEKSLSMMFLSVMEEDKFEGILDSQIKSEENSEFLEEMAELARQCLEMKGANRPSMKEVAENLGRLRRVMHHPWVQQSPQEMESLLGESSSMASSMVVSSENFNIEKKAAAGLESGR